MGAIEKTLEALDERVGGACQVVAICGRNKSLIERLSNRSAFSPHGWSCVLACKSCILPCILYVMYSAASQVVQRRAEG